MSDSFMFMYFTCKTKASTPPAIATLAEVPEKSVVHELLVLVVTIEGSGYLP